MGLSDIHQKIGKNAPSAVLRQKRVLFSQQIEHITSPPIWKKGTGDLSAFFDPSVHDLSPSQFKTLARNYIPPESSTGLQTHQEGKKVMVEIFFSSEEARIHYCNHGIPGDGFTIYGFPALPPKSKILRIKLSHIPFISEDKLTNGIFDMLAPYGLVLEGGIYIDHGWFDGSGFAVLQLPSQQEDAPALSHVLPWDDNSISYATWTNMPIHCTYCHQPNHIRLDCPVRSALRCWTCLAQGHLRVHCPTLKQTPNKGYQKKKTKKTNKTNKTSKSQVPTKVTKRSPPSSESDNDEDMLVSESPTRHPPLKQPRPRPVRPTPLDNAKNPPSSSQNALSTNQPLTFDDKLRMTTPENFARALGGQ